MAMDVSVHSYLRLIRLAEPMMQNGGTCMTVSFYGSEEVVEDYNIMGPVKAALESVHALCRRRAWRQDDLRQRALSGTAGDSGRVRHRPFRRDAGRCRRARARPITLARIEDIGAYAAFLASEEARNVTGATVKIDGGYSIMG